MPISDVPKQPDYSEVRKAAENIKTADDMARKEAEERRRREKELRDAVDAANRRKGESSKQK
jgi:hypothetical protein